MEWLRIGTLESDCLNLNSVSVTYHLGVFGQVINNSVIFLFVKLEC